MKLGAIFPQLEIGANPEDIRTYARGVEELGYDHILAYDHVLGADITARPDWQGPYTAKSLFHEPFVLFGYMAALTRLELVTGVIVLPQRQTALVAKQAAQVDLLTGGRFRLGVGVGWNEVEYESLGASFRDRGVRSEEQIAVLRRLFTEPSVQFSGRWHTIREAGINPLPVQRPIPIWLGGGAEPLLRRVGRLGDGWFPQRGPDEEARAMLARIQGYAIAAGRDATAIGIEARLPVAQVNNTHWKTYAEAWRALGATHLTVNTMGAGLHSVAGHLDTLAQVKAALRA